MPVPKLLDLRHRSDLWLAVALVAVAFYAGCNAFPEVRFDRERIEVWVVPQQIRVSGLYHYRNPSLLPAWYSLELPFPVDEEHPRPSIYSIAAVTEGCSTVELIPTKERNSAVEFRIFLRPRESKWVRVTYVQGANTPRGTYILTTTRKWHRALEEGDYILHMGKVLQLESSNYAADASATGERNTYTFSKTDFYPSEDWNFTWRDAGGASSGSGGP